MVNLISQYKPLNNLGCTFFFREGGEIPTLQCHHTDQSYASAFFHICVSIDVDAAMRKSHHLLRTEQRPFLFFFFFCGFITLASRLVGIVKPVNSTSHANTAKHGIEYQTETSRG